MAKVKSSNYVDKLLTKKMIILSSIQQLLHFIYSCPVILREQDRLTISTAKIEDHQIKIGKSLRYFEGFMKFNHS